MFGNQTHTVSMDRVMSDSLKKEHHGQSILHGCTVLGITWATTQPNSREKPMPTVPNSARNRLFANIANAIDAQFTAAHNTAPVDVTYVYATIPSGRGSWAPQHPQANAVVTSFIKGHFERRRVQVNVRMVPYRNTNTAAGVTVSYYPHYYRDAEGPVSIS